MSNVVASLPILASALPSRKTTRKTGASSSYAMSRPKASHPLGSDTHSKASREGIMRQDEVELEFHDNAPANLEDGHNTRGHISKDAYQVEQNTMPWASTNRI